jgi:hypothetical protein
MAPALCADQAPVPPPSYHRSPAGALHRVCVRVLGKCAIQVSLAENVTRRLAMTSARCLTAPV